MEKGGGGGKNRDQRSKNKDQSRSKLGNEKLVADHNLARSMIP